MTTDRGRLMGIDYGEKRVGLAISDPSGTIASPAGVIVRRAEALEARGIVMGLPLDGNGDETPRSIEARAVAEEVGRRTGLPVEMIDERYSTAAALRAIHEMGGSTKGRKGDVDALAATILLQHALQRTS